METRENVGSPCRLDAWLETHESETDPEIKPLVGGIFQRLKEMLKSPKEEELTSPRRLFLAEMEQENSSSPPLNETESAAVRSIFDGVKGILRLPTPHRMKMTKYANVLDQYRSAVNLMEVLGETPSTVVGYSEFKELVSTLYEGDVHATPRENYQRLVHSMDRLAEILKKHPTDQRIDRIRSSFYHLLEVRWSKTYLSNHLHHLIESFIGKALSGVSLSLLPETMRAWNALIREACKDPAKGKNLLSEGKQKAKGALGVQYYTSKENLIHVRDIRYYSSGRSSIRLAGGSPTVGIGYLDVLIRVGTKAFFGAEDSLAPNFLAFLESFKGDILFTIHQTAVPLAVEDESGRVRAIKNAENETFHVMIQSLNPLDNTHYVIPNISEPKRFNELKNKLLNAFADSSSYPVTGVSLPAWMGEEYRISTYSYFEELTLDLKNLFFEGLDHFSQKEWLAFVQLFYVCQKFFVEKEFEKRKGKFYQITHDPCKDDLDRGGCKWFTEMLFLGSLTGQIEDPLFLRDVLILFLGRPLLVKKQGVFTRWLEVAFLLSEKFRDVEKEKIRSFYEKHFGKIDLKQILFPRETVSSFGLILGVIPAAKAPWLPPEVLSSIAGALSIQHPLLGYIRYPRFDCCIVWNGSADTVPIFKEGRLYDTEERSLEVILHLKEKDESLDVSKTPLLLFMDHLEEGKLALSLSPGDCHFLLNLDEKGEILKNTLDEAFERERQGIEDQQKEKSISLKALFFLEKAKEALYQFYDYFEENEPISSPTISS